MNIKVKTLSPNAFYTEVSAFAMQANTDVLDAVLNVCDQNGIEIETAASLVKNHPKLKAMVEEAGENINVLPKTSRLSFD